VKKNLGVYLATHGSPTFLRLSLLQMYTQTRLPDYISIFENGNVVSFKPLVLDVLNMFEELEIPVIFRHHDGKLEHPKFHHAALKELVFVDAVDLFTKFDHDDLFYRDHLESLVRELGDNDAAVNQFGEAAHCARGEEPFIKPLMSFEHVNPTGGMSDCVIFNRAVAETYIKDMEEAPPGLEDDYILGKITLGNPSFNVRRYKATPTACYITHGNNDSQIKWLRGSGKDKPNAAA
jgi:hypothetical protein